MKKFNRIYLTGFMGAGKSTLGVIIANTLGWNFVDLDHVIEKEIGMKIAQYFAENGESAFRECERTALIKTFTLQRTVIALGGGAVTYSDNVSLLQEQGLLVYLKSTPEQIYQRLRFKMDRPIFQTKDKAIASKEEAMQKIRGLLQEREKFYLQASLVFESEDASIGKSVDHLIGLLQKRIDK